jgi:thiazole synthase ThiGH ThiG subunit
VFPHVLAIAEYKLIPSSPRTVQANVPLKTLIPEKYMLLALVADSVCLCENINDIGADVMFPNVVVPETAREIALTPVSVD